MRLGTDRSDVRAGNIDNDYSRHRESLRASFAGKEKFIQRSFSAAMALRGDRVCHRCAERYAVARTNESVNETGACFNNDSR